MTTPADELRTAAQKIRDRAAAVAVNNHPDLPWHTEECADDERGNCPCIVTQGRHIVRGAPPTPLFYVADAETPECAAYIAAMGPNVGTALADWLEFHAAMDDRLHALVDGTPELDEATWGGKPHPAITIARAINAGGQR